MDVAARLTRLRAISPNHSSTRLSHEGEDIGMYSGLKHSSCSQYINQRGYSLDEVQMMTDHARRNSVKRYAAVQLETKRRLLEGKQGRVE
jgi:hypothetical protein